MRSTYNCNQYSLCHTAGSRYTAMDRIKVPLLTATVSKNLLIRGRHRLYVHRVAIPDASVRGHRVDMIVDSFSDGHQNVLKDPGLALSQSVNHILVQFQTNPDQNVSAKEQVLYYQFIGCPQ